MTYKHRLIHTINLHIWQNDLQGYSGLNQPYDGALYSWIGTLIIPTD